MEPKSKYLLKSSDPLAYIRVKRGRKIEKYPAVKDQSFYDKISKNVLCAFSFRTKKFKNIKGG